MKASKKVFIKNYIIDTNIFVEDFNAIQNLLDNGKNKVSVPVSVIIELDGLKNDKKIGYIVRKAIHEIKKYYEEDKITILDQNGDWFNNYNKLPDGKVLDDILNSKLDCKDENIFLTNDNVFNILAKQAIDKKNIHVEPYQTKGTYISDPQKFTGILNNTDDNKINASNYFTLIDGQYYFNSSGKLRLVEDRNVWKISPRDLTQKLAIDLMLNDDIKIVTLQSKAGAGKTMLALACALYETFEKKKYDKIVFVKPMYEIGTPLGFLPGDVNDKIFSYFEYALDLLLFLNDKRKATKIFNDPSNYKKVDEKVFKFMPLNFIRGMNLNNTLLICDEFQSVNKHEVKSILTRCGEGSKVIVCGDVEQIDNPNVNKDNNALSLLVRNMVEDPIYAHLVMNSKHSRGPIANSILNSGL